MSKKKSTGTAWSKVETLEEVGEIHPTVYYTLPRFKKLTGLGEHSIRQARREGLVFRKIGRQSFIKGSDWITWADAHGSAY